MAIHIHVQLPDGHVLTWEEKVTILNRRELASFSKFMFEFNKKVFGVDGITHIKTQNDRQVMPDDWRWHP